MRALLLTTTVLLVLVAAPIGLVGTASANVCVLDENDPTRYVVCTADKAECVARAVAWYVLKGETLACPA